MVAGISGGDAPTPTEETTDMKKTLIHTNPYLRDPARREALLRRQALNSSVFEGARGLKVQSSCRVGKTGRLSASVCPAVIFDSKDDP